MVSHDGAASGFTPAAPRLPPPPKMGHSSLPSLGNNDPHRLSTAPALWNGDSGGNDQKGTKWNHGHNRGLVSEQQQRVGGAATHRSRGNQDMPSPPETSRGSRPRPFGQTMPLGDPSPSSGSRRQARGSPLGAQSERQRAKPTGSPNRSQTLATPQQRGLGTSQQRLPTSSSAPVEAPSFTTGVGTHCWGSSTRKSPSRRNMPDQTWGEVRGADKGKSRRARDGRVEFSVQVLAN
jgi:hypothetical protein